MAIKKNIDDAMRDVWDYDNGDEVEEKRKVGRPRKGTELRVNFSGRVDPATMATLVRHKIAPSVALEMIAKKLREKKSQTPLQGGVDAV